MKYFVWKYYLRQETGWIGTHIAAGPRITVTMILAGIIQIYTGFFSTPWYEIAIWLALAFQIWLSFGWGYVYFFPITKEDVIKFEQKLKR